MEEARRRWLLDSMTSECPLEYVAEAIASHAKPGSDVYVAQGPGGYRWSPTHPGGAYPLQREVALMIDLSHYDFALPFDTVDGWGIVRAAGLAETDVVAASFIEARTDARANVERISSALTS
jgi:hypothetical protein